MEKNIIITGGGLANKGAQAMTFIAVSELKKKFPNHRILVLSTEDLKRPKEQLEKLSFEFIGWYPQKFAKCQNNPILRLMYKVISKEELAEAETIYKNTVLMIDISGYALGSDWTSKICNDFLDNFEFAKSFNIPVYILPQSFGPFNFNEKGMHDIEKRVRKILPSIKVICAREQEGYDLLCSQYGLKNVVLLPDLVLNNKEIDICSVYKEVPSFNLPRIRTNSVAIIPNNQNLTVAPKEQVLSLYKTAINCLLEMGKYVYLMHHSSLDIGICSELKDSFFYENKVILLEEDFSCLEFNSLVQKFDYMIASRFHSIVHAYKNGIPCVTVGWAKKYDVLLEEFGQGEYLFDLRYNIDVKEFIKAIELLNDRVQFESNRIVEHLKEIQKENIFEILQL